MSSHCWDTSGLFRGEDVHLRDVGWPDEEGRCVCHQRLSHLARKVSLPAGVVLERVEDAELGRTDADRVPRDGVRLRLDERQRSLQKRGDLFFLARLRLHAGEDPELHHVATPSAKTVPRNSIASSM